MVRGKHGHFLYNANDIYVGKSLELYGEYSEHESYLFKKIVRPDTIVIEIGANVGSQTVLLSRLAGENGIVYAFEPQHIIFQNLCANLALNGIKNAKAYPYACGKSNGTIFVPPVNYEISGNFGGISMDESIGEKVKLIALDEWLCIEKSISLIKIDVEGMEQQVINGLSQTIKIHKPILFIENDRIEKSQSLIETLWNLGYICYWHITPLFNEDNFFRERRNVFENLVSINMLCSTEEINSIEGVTKILNSNEHPWR